MQAGARAEDPAVGLTLHARRRGGGQLEAFHPRFLGEHGPSPCSPNSLASNSSIANAERWSRRAESLPMGLARLHPFAFERSHSSRPAHDPPVRADAPRRDPRVRLAHDDPLEAGRWRHRPRHPRHRLGRRLRRDRRPPLPRPHVVERGADAEVEGHLRGLARRSRRLGRDPARDDRRRDRRPARRGQRHGVHGRRRARAPARAGDRPDRQLVEPGALRQADVAAVGPEDRSRAPGEPAGAVRRGARRTTRPSCTS